MSSDAISEHDRLTRLQPPEQPVEIVLDTDTYNEIDDQFALVYSLCSDAIDVSAVYAAPFHNDRSTGPGDGMELSYEEIQRVLDRLDYSARDDFVYRGTTEFMSGTESSLENPATADLIDRARDRDADEPLYVVPIGAPTNVSLAIKQAPEIIENIVVVWLGGQPHTWHSAAEFNLQQDIAASQILYDSGVPFVQVPCKNVAEHIRSTVPELEYHLGDGGPMSQYLLEIFTEYGDKYAANAWAKEIWDIAPIAYLVNPDWVPSHLSHSPWLSEDLRYSHDPHRHLMRVAQDVNRGAIFDDFFATLDGR